MSTVCFFNSTKNWGGGEKWHLDIATHLHNNNKSVLIIVRESSALHKRVRQTSIPFKTITVKNLSFLNFYKVKKLATIFKENNIGMVIMNSSEDMKFAGLAAKKAKVKHLIYRRGSAIPIKNTFINRYFFKNVLTEILANSQATKKTLVQNNENLFDLNKITVISNGLKTKQFLQKKIKKVYNSQNKDELVLGNLGRLVYQKNQTFLIKLAKELKDRGLNFKIIIGGSGKLLENLKNEAKKLNVEHHVMFAGFIENPRDLYESIDIFVLPSHWEGFGYVIAESMLCEKPVIAFDISSNPELIINDYNGYLVDKDDLEQTSTKIMYLNKNKEKLKELGTQGKKHIENNFDISITLNKVKEFIYDRI